VVATYEAWLRADPGNPVARHLLAACIGKGVPARASDGFVAGDFDRFAETFDDVLGGLEYRAPALVGAALERIDGAPRGELAILDAGCGTGLLAPHLRPYARRLVGVDLSPKMLEKAAKRALYDATVVAELTAFLRTSPQAFDIVASSDTLNYFGDLREVLAAARASLRPGGRLVFTLEHAVREEEVPAGYRLHPGGRYMHARPYVLATLADAGFEVVAAEPAALRREGDAYVDGLVVAARRPRL
jgi:predicted TPR repeat methyltransferase